MATPAQIEANRINSQRSTGPRTPEGKAAVAQNRTTHGLTGEFRVLSCENERDYALLLMSYMDEYQPKTSTEHFFVNELAQAQWRIMRADAIEAELLNPGENQAYAAVAASFRDGDALTRLGRYAQAARRAYYKAYEKLQALRQSPVRQPRNPERIDDRPRPVAIPADMPPNFQRELDRIVERKPDFHPEQDSSQMSPGLRRWYERHQGLAA